MSNPKAHAQARGLFLHIFVSAAIDRGILVGKCWADLQACWHAGWPVVPAKVDLHSRHVSLSDGNCLQVIKIRSRHSPPMRLADTLTLRWALCVLACLPARFVGCSVGCLAGCLISLFAWSLALFCFLFSLSWLLGCLLGSLAYIGCLAWLGELINRMGWLVAALGVCF